VTAVQRPLGFAVAQQDDSCFIGRHSPDPMGCGP
jgi:hypothetical protein